MNTKLIFKCSVKHQSKTFQKVAGKRNALVCAKKYSYLQALNHVLLGPMARLPQNTPDPSLELKTGCFPGCSRTCPWM